MYCSDGRHLDTPELHTTLHLGRDILSLQTMNIDIVEAVKHRLTVSDQDRRNIKQKVSHRSMEKIQHITVSFTICSGMICFLNKKT